MIVYLYQAPVVASPHALEALMELICCDCPANSPCQSCVEDAQLVEPVGQC